MKLKENELEVFRLLWQESPQKPADIQKAFQWEIDNGTLIRRHVSREFLDDRQPIGQRFGPEENPSHNYRVKR